MCNMTEQTKAKATTALDTLLAIFKAGDLPEKIAYATLTGYTKPSHKWSLPNRLLMLHAGTEDARGRKQWESVERKVKAWHPVWIIAPRKSECIVCPACRRYFFTKTYNRKTKKFDDIAGEARRKLAEHLTQDHGNQYAAGSVNYRDALKQTPAERLIGFKDVPVHAVENTDGKPLPVVAPRELPPLLKVAEAFETSVVYEGFEGGAYGSCKLDGSRIILRVEDAVVFLHELAHRADIKLGQYKTNGQEQNGYAYGEVVAELTAAVLAELYGWTGYRGTSFDYIKHWSGIAGDDALKAVGKVLARVQKVLELIIDTAEKLGEAVGVSPAVPEIVETPVEIPQPMIVEIPGTQFEMVLA